MIVRPDSLFFFFYGMNIVKISIFILSGLFFALEPAVSDDQNNSTDIGKELRLMALNTTAEALKLKPDKKYPFVFGVVMDWKVGNGVASIVGLRDGTASLYTTTGFGIIGSGGHESASRLAKEYVQLAQPLYYESKEIATYDYPSVGKVYFYFLTYGGVRLYIGDEEAITKKIDLSSSLFSAAQNLLTEMRMMTNK